MKHITRFVGVVLAASLLALPTLASASPDTNSTTPATTQSAQAQAGHNEQTGDQGETQSGQTGDQGETRSGQTGDQVETQSSQTGDQSKHELGQPDDVNPANVTGTSAGAGMQSTTQATGAAAAAAGEAHQPDHADHPAQPAGSTSNGGNQQEQHGDN